MSCICAKRDQLKQPMGEPLGEIYIVWRGIPK